MNKIKILVIYSDNVGGVGYFRSVNPHIYLQSHYSDEFDIDILYQCPRVGDFYNMFIKYDIIQFHKMLDKDGALIDAIRKANPNAKIVLDIDDYYRLPKEHPFYYGSTVVNKTYEGVLNNIRKADYVTTTTNIFKNELKKSNKNVFVIPNAINPEEKQFMLDKKPSSRIRFGLVCGSSHLHDVNILKDCIDTLSEDTLSKIQICLCGFNTEGKFTSYSSDGKKTVRDILPTESVYYQMERVLTKDYTLVSQAHKDFLLKFIPNTEDPFTDEPYRRHWTLDIDHYYQHYNHVDVLLAPLVENLFNACKSQLKLIEAGFAHIPLICQNFGPYTLDTIPYLLKGNKVNEEGNSFLVDSVKNHKQWNKYITYIANNPECITKAGENLYKLVKERFSLEHVAKVRKNFYKTILS